MGLAGHILAPDFPDEILFDKKMGWYSLTEDCLLYTSRCV